MWSKQYRIIFIHINLLTVSALSIGDLVIKVLYLVSFHILGQFTKILDWIALEDCCGIFVITKSNCIYLHQKSRILHCRFENLEVDLIWFGCCSNQSPKTWIDFKIDTGKETGNQIGKMENHIGRQIKKMLGFLPKTENQMLKNQKNANRNSFQCKTDKTDLKNDQFILTKKPKIYGIYGILHGPDSWWGFLYIRLIFPRFWTFCIEWFAFLFSLAWHWKQRICSPAIVCYTAHTVLLERSVAWRN